MKNIIIKAGTKVFPKAFIELLERISIHKKSCEKAIIIRYIAPISITCASLMKIEKIGVAVKYNNNETKTP